MLDDVLVDRRAESATYLTVESAVESEGDLWHDVLVDLPAELASELPSELASGMSSADAGFARRGGRDT